MNYVYWLGIVFYSGQRRQRNATPVTTVSSCSTPQTIIIALPLSIYRCYSFTSGKAASITGGWPVIHAFRYKKRIDTDPHVSPVTTPASIMLRYG